MSVLVVVEDWASGELSVGFRLSGYRIFFWNSQIWGVCLLPVADTGTIGLFISAILLCTSVWCAYGRCGLSQNVATGVKPTCTPALKLDHGAAQPWNASTWETSAQRVSIYYPKSGGKFPCPRLKLMLWKVRAQTGDAKIV